MLTKKTWLALIWALFIMTLCGIPGKDIPHVSFLELLSFDKFVHAFVFFVLIVLVINSTKQNNPFKHKYYKRIAAILCIFYGGILEIMQQTLFTERSANIYDFIANSIGVIAGFLFFERINKILNTKFNI